MSIIKNKELSLGRGTYTNATYEDCTFTDNLHTTFKDCTFKRCTFKNNVYVEYVKCNLDRFCKIL